MMQSLGGISPDSRKPSTSLAHRLPGDALCLLLFALVVYRAIQQSLTHDEATAWLLYVDGPWRNVFHWVDAGNHFLFSLLARFSVSILGASEFAMRLPSVLAAAVYLVTVRRLARWVFEDRILSVACIGLLAANPLVLDLLVAARGYSLSLAGIAVALFALARYDSGEPRPMLLTEAAAGLSVAVMANVTLVVPAFVVSLLVVARVPRRHWPAFFAPAFVLALFYLGLFTPLRHMGREQLYAGLATLHESLESLGRASLAHNEGFFAINRFSALQYHGARILAWGLWPVACLAALPVLRNKSRAAVAGRLAAIVVLASWGFLAAGHFFAGLLYPLDRTGVYFLPLCGLVVVTLAAALPAPARWAPLALAALLLASYTVQLNWTHFAAWRYDADTRELVRALDFPSPPRRLGVSLQLEPAARFYLRGTSSKPEIFSRDRLRPGLDAYLLSPDDAARVQEWDLRVVSTGSISGALLAVPAR